MERLDRVVSEEAKLDSIKRFNELLESSRNFDVDALEVGYYEDGSGAMFLFYESNSNNPYVLRLHWHLPEAVAVAMYRAVGDVLNRTEWEVARGDCHP